MSFFDTISRIIQQGKEMAVKATPSSTLTYNKVTPVDNSQFTSNPLLRDKPLTYQPPVVQQPTFNVPVKAEIPQASTRVAETTPQQTNLTMAQQVSNIIQGGKEAAVLGGGLAKDVARGTTRGAMAGGTFVGARLLGADVNTASQVQFKPKTGLEKFLFGEQPVSVQSEGIAPLESMGVSPDTAKKYGAPFVLGSIALDAFTGGSSKAAKKTLEKVAANMTAEDATLLRNLYARPTAKDVLPIARNEQAIITALKLDKLPYAEQKKAVSNILEAYEKRWGGVDEALNPPVKPNRAGAMDVKKPTPLGVDPKNFKTADEFVAAQGETTYRGASVKEWEDVKNTGSFSDREGTTLIDKSTGKPIKYDDAGKNTTTSKELADSYAKNSSNEGVTIEFKPEAKAKMRFSAKFDSSDLQADEFLGEGLDINDVARVTDKNGKVIYESSDLSKTKSQLTDIWKQANTKQKPNKMADYRAGKPNSEGGYIRNPLAGKGETPKANNQVVSSGNDSTRLSLIDRLIADNKVRVVSRDGRDVYQVKKGGEWVNKRDEDSAIRAVTPRSPIDVIKKTKAPKFASEVKPQTKLIATTQPKVRQMSRSRDVAWLEREATDRALREQKRIERQTSPAFRSVLDEPTQLSPERVTQLEKSAMPTADVVRPSTPYKAESLANVITKTPLDRKVNIIDYLRTPDRVLNKIGFGKEAKLLRDQYEKYSVELPKNIDKISAWVKRAPEKGASERIFQYLDGKTVKLSATEEKVADEIRAYLKDWADRLGLPEENRVANYITRLFDDQLIKQEFDEDLAKIISGKIPGEVYNPFLQKRLGAKGYKQDVWGALDAYTKRATRKVHLDPALDRIREKAGSSLDFTQLEESQFKYIQRYIDRVQMRPTEVDNAIDNAVKQTLGYRFGQRPVTTVSRFLRRMTYRGMLGANLGSALRNLSQGVNTYAVLGEKYTAIGYAKLLQPASQRELIEQGIFNNNFIEDRVLSSTKKLLQKGDKALWFFFDRAEKINRGSAYLGAKAKGLGRGMTEQQAIDYAKNIVRKTQFSYDAVDQPVALGSDIMKTMFQFQTYTTKQAEFLTEMVKDKNVVGLLRYAIGGYLFVNTVGKALGMEESELVPLWDTITGERKFSPAPSLKFPIELTKAIADTPDRYGNDRDLEQKAKDVGKSLIGLIPGGTQIKKTYEGYKASQEGGSFDKAGRKQFEVGDSKASQLQAILFGKYANQNAKDYFNKETNTGNKELDETIKDSKEKEKNRSKDAEAMLVSLKSLPPDRANAVMKELKINDEAMFNKVKALKQAEDLNWSKEEKAIANLGVTDGTKARYVYSQVNKLGTAEEKNAYLKELLDRKIISKEVLKQIKDLKEGGKNNDIIE